MPKRTVWLIDRLAELGLTNEVFTPLHHLGTPLEDHRRYCDEDVSSFSSRTNADVRNRLEYMYREIQERDLKAPLPEGLWEALAQESLDRYPMEGGNRMTRLLGNTVHEPTTSPATRGGDTEAGDLDEEILKAFMESFFGYGSPNGDYWFIGMEEGGGSSFREVDCRLRCWNERGRKTHEDLREFHEAFGEHRWFSWRQLQPTWAKLIRVLLSVKGLPHEGGDVRSYQSEKLGRDAGETCLMELMPLPSQSTSHWQYAAWSNLPVLRSRQSYLKAMGAPRTTRIAQLVAGYSPKAIVFYGSTYRNIWSALCPPGAPFKTVQIADNELLLSRRGPTVYAICAHPTKRGVSNRYFDAVGRKIRELVAT